MKQFVGHCSASQLKKMFLRFYPQTSNNHELAAKFAKECTGKSVLFYSFKNSPFMYLGNFVLLEGLMSTAYELIESFLLLDFLFDLCIINSNHNASLNFLSLIFFPSFSFSSFSFSYSLSLTHSSLSLTPPSLSLCSSSLPHALSTPTT